VQRAGRILRATCLTQSIALAAVLERVDRPATLVLGCRQYDDGYWGAHAWVVVGDEILEPVPSGPHAELARLHAAGGWVPIQPGARN
jgi:transglutaminase superfamily protein